MIRPNERVRTAQPFFFCIFPAHPATKLPITSVVRQGDNAPRTQIHSCRRAAYETGELKC